MVPIHHHLNKIFTKKILLTMQFHIIKILGGYEYTFIYISDLKYIHNNKIINMLIQRNSATCFILTEEFSLND